MTHENSPFIWSLCSACLWAISVAVPPSHRADVLPPFLVGGLFEEVYPGNSGQCSTSCVTGAQRRPGSCCPALSLLVFISPVSPSLQPSAAESCSVCSYVTASAYWFMKHKRLNIWPWQHTHGHIHKQWQLQHFLSINPSVCEYGLSLILMLCELLKPLHKAVTYS